MRSCPRRSDCTAPPDANPDHLGIEAGRYRRNRPYARRRPARSRRHRRGPAGAAGTRPVGVDAVVAGGALYANRWHPPARRLVEQRIADLRRTPVWFVSSGPLDDSATQGTLPASPQVDLLMARAGAQGHITVDRWADQIARALPSARPDPVIDLPGRELHRLFTHAVAGWAACASIMPGLLALMAAPWPSSPTP